MASKSKLRKDAGDSDDDSEMSPAKLLKPNASCSKKPQTSQHRNPVGSLQELAAKRSWMAPVYEELTSPSDTGFSVTCKLGGHTTTALAPIKKLAKREAASKMLEKVTKNDDSENTPNKIVDAPVKTAVSQLHEYCQKNKRQILYSENPVDEEDQFSIICKVGGNEVEGIGPTKKIAKNDAAKKMIKELNFNLCQ